MFITRNPSCDFPRVSTDNTQYDYVYRPGVTDKPERMKLQVSQENGKNGKMKNESLAGDSIYMILLSSSIFLDLDVKTMKLCAILFRRSKTSVGIESRRLTPNRGRMRHQVDSDTLQTKL